MNEAMLAFITKLDNSGSVNELSNKDCKSLIDVVKQLGRLGILMEPETADPSNKQAVPDGAGSMTHLAIFVTTKCNLRCAYCYARGGDTEKTISRDIWRPTIDHFFSTLSADADQGRANRKSVNLSIHGGGEATVEFATLKEIVAEFRGRAHAAGLESSVGMGTNGTYSDSVSQWIIKNNISVNISLDGPRNIQNLLRPFRSGQPSYDVVIRNLQSLVNAGRCVSV